MSIGAEISFMGQVMKCFDLAIDNKEAERSVSKLWYLGDPCYVVAKEKWDLFCQKTWDDKARANAENNGWMDAIIEWEGERLEIWSNGGDGTWEFNFAGKKAEKTPLNGNKAEFCVDAGIFCIMPVKVCDVQDIDKLKSLGMVFKHEPELYVNDNVVYINDVPDESVQECPNCDEMIQRDSEEYCETGECVGCWHCFECDCEDGEE